MQRIRTLLLFFIAAATVFLACRKEPSAPAASTGIAPGHPKDGGGDDCVLGASVQCGMLSFADQAHFGQVRECLEARYEAFLDWLYQEFGHLEDDEFDDAVEQYGTNEDSQILAFLSSLPGYNSYWTMYESALNQFLASGGEPWNFTIPDLFGSPIEAALHNTMGAVMIGGVIHVTRPDGEQWVFCDCQAYQAWAADPENYQHDPGDPCVEHSVKQFNCHPVSGICCADYANMCHWNSYANRRNMRVKLRYAYEPLEGSAVIGYLDSWRKRGSRWMRAYVKLTVGGITGLYGTGDCTSRANIGVSAKTRRSRSLVRGARVPGQWFFINASILGNFSWLQGAITYSDQIVLDAQAPPCWD